MSEIVDVVIVGAGPYGLSIAAHLRKTRVNFRIFGAPMQTWAEQMPAGMMLKSDGFASNLYDPESAFTLGHYCAEKKLPYADVGIPVPLETFAAYGLEFQKRFVPDLEPARILAIQRSNGGFQLKTAQGETVLARKVVVAVGITHFSYLPPFLSDLPAQYVSHSLQHHDLSVFQGKKVAVIGAGASAVDIAAILNKSGAEVSLIARRRAIAFHKPSKEPRPLLQRIAKPRSGLGPGWRSRLCTDAPLLFHTLPHQFRIPVVRKHLGPAPGWFVRDQVVDRFPLHLGATLRSAEVENGQVRINFVNTNGGEEELAADHVIGATGFRVAISKLGFLDETIQQQIHTIEDTPVLSNKFESSVPGLYMVGIASANSFGPLTRFAYGAKFTAGRISSHLAQRSRA
jgi:cation diffusion facilitator CzcD-associated flavoprotein CzcO